MLEFKSFLTHIQIYNYSSFFQIEIHTVKVKSFSNMYNI